MIVLRYQRKEILLCRRDIDEGGGNLRNYYTFIEVFSLKCFQLKTFIQTKYFFIFVLYTIITTTTTIISFHSYEKSLIFLLKIILILIHLTISIMRIVFFSFSLSISLYIYIHEG